MKTSVVSRDPDVMGGAAVFRGTRVPVQILLDTIAAGDTIDAFLAGVPSVTRGQVIAFLEEIKAGSAKNPTSRKSYPFSTFGGSARKSGKVSTPPNTSPASEIRGSPSRTR